MFNGLERPVVEGVFFGVSERKNTINPVYHVSQGTHHVEGRLVISRPMCGQVFKEQPRAVRRIPDGHRVCGRCLAKLGERVPLGYVMDACLSLPPENWSKLNDSQRERVQHLINDLAGVS